nr:hypothetical protein [Tanacetum cinerariifolium]
LQRRAVPCIECPGCFPVSRRGIAPVGLPRIPLVAEAFEIRVAVLADNGRDLFWVCGGEAQADGRAVIKYVKCIPAQPQRLGEALDDLVKVVEGVIERSPGGGGCVAKTGQVRRDHTVLAGQQRHQVTEHVARSRKAVQQQEHRGIFWAGFAVEHLDIADLLPVKGDTKSIIECRDIACLGRMLAGRRTHKRTAQGRRCACARHSDSKHFAPTDASVAELRVVDLNDLVAGFTQICEQAFQRTEQTNVVDRQAQLLADLPDNGVGAALPELDAAAQGPKQYSLFHGVRKRIDQNLALMGKDANGDVTNAGLRHGFPLEAGADQSRLHDARQALLTLARATPACRISDRYDARQPREQRPCREQISRQLPTAGHVRGPFRVWAEVRRHPPRVFCPPVCSGWPGAYRGLGSTGTLWPICPSRRVPYEWLTGQQLNVPDVTNGGYVDAVSSKRYLTRAEPLRLRRWRINNNLPGVPAFCPMVRRTDAVQQALQFDLDVALRELNQTFGADILMRTASWLTFKESRASFLIEKEADQADRIQRFAHVIASLRSSDTWRRAAGPGSGNCLRVCVYPSHAGRQWPDPSLPDQRHADP